jgi:hypothetical protein
MPPPGGTDGACRCAVVLRCYFALTQGSRPIRACCQRLDDAAKIPDPGRNVAETACPRRKVAAFGIYKLVERAVLTAL